MFLDLLITPTENRNTRAPQPGPVVSLVAVVALLAGCSGGGGDVAAVAPAPIASPVLDCATNPTDCGEVFIGLTDADGDFLTYSVSVDSLSLERSDGARIETLPRSAVVDFAAYTELTEFFSAATVPPGTYVSGSLTLDFSAAEVLVEKSGVATAATVTDELGAALGTATFTVRLSDRDRLVVRRGLPSLLVVDFDLNASHKVDLDADPVEARAQPFFLAEIDPVDTKSMRVRGPLIDVDTEGSAYVVALRPFNLRDGRFGRVTVHTTADTAYEIDGVTLIGEDGLAALAGQPDGAATVATGLLDVAARRYEASEVFAGSSVPGGDMDVLTGRVFAREQNSLSVHGTTLVRADGTAIFNDSVTVTLGEATDVVKVGDPGFDGGIAAVSVGQTVTVFGAWSAETDSPGRMDASDGRVRLLPTRMSGVVSTVNAGLVTVDLGAIGGRDPLRFDFAGTGSPGEDANPDAYEVDTGQLPLDIVAPGHPVRFSGFVTPFGLAPPDFAATTIADYSQDRARMDIDWESGATDQFVALDETGIVINLDNGLIGERHRLRRGGIAQDLLELDPPPVVVARPGGGGLFAIRDEGGVQIYTGFADFTAGLAMRQAEGRSVFAFHAGGGYDNGSGLFTAARIAVRLDR